MIDFLTKSARRFLTGKEADYTFRKCHEPAPNAPSETHLYIHIPFCKNLCPYCPYNKVEYDSLLVHPYIDSLLTEIELYGERYGRLTVPSVYFGGGTPTLLIDEFEVVITKLKEYFDIRGHIAVETNPKDISEEGCAKLKSIGINQISIGAQSFSNKRLEFIGRDYDATYLKEKLRIIEEAGFESVNVDLMFAFPGQTEIEFEKDLQQVLEFSPDQITAYPLFTFPYTAAAEHLNLKRVKMPTIRQRHSLYNKLFDVMESNRYDQTSVWSFKRGNTPRYSSVTRDSFIGLGAGAASQLDNDYLFNTFSVSAYNLVLSQRKFPTALHMPLTDKMSKYYWLYWRCYDAQIPKTQLYERFGKSDIKLKLLLKTARLIGMISDEQDNYALTRRGSFWIHWLQNQFALNYVDKVWTTAMKEPYPSKIEL